MDYRLKVRIENGPGIPFDLSRLQQPDARKPLKALFGANCSWTDGQQIWEGAGSTTACLFVTRVRRFSSHQEAFHHIRR